MKGPDIIKVHTYDSIYIKYNLYFLVKNKYNGSFTSGLTMWGALQVHSSKLVKITNKNNLLKFQEMVLRAYSKNIYSRKSSITQ